MENIFESLITSSVIETPQSAKDKKQRNKYPQTKLKKTVEIHTPKDDSVDVINNIDIWESEERRKGNDRRQDKSERGRYFESRDKGNRRIKKDIHIKI